MALLLAGCGGASAVRPPAYVKSICRALGDWKNTIQSAGLALQSSGASGAAPPTAKQDYEKFISELVRATRRVTTALRAAGVPEVSGGTRIADGLTAAFDRATRRLAEASAAARRIPTSSVSGFQTGAGAVTGQIRFALAGLASVTPGASPQLRTAAANEPTCQVLQG
jgi:hypothetical protein